MSRCLTSCQKRLFAHGKRENYMSATKNLRSKYGSERQNRMISTGKRRQSLTLATAWGEPYLGKSVLQQATPVRKFHPETHFKMAVKSQGNVAVKTDDSRVDVQNRRRSSQAATLSTENVSRCPFHAVFGQKRAAYGEHDLSAAHVNSRGDVISQPADSSSETIVTSMKQLITTYHDTKRNGRKRLLNFLKNFSKTDYGTTVSSNTRAYSDIPGPRGLPLLGSVLDYTFLGPFSPRQFHKALLSRHSKFGKIFREKFLSEEFVYISDPSDVEVLIHNEGAAPCRPHIDAIVESRKQGGYPVGITALQGEEWGKLRGAVNSAVMRPNIVRTYLPAQKEVADDFIDFIQTEKSTKTGEIKDFEVWLNRWALESVAVILLDTRLGLITKDGEKKADPVAERLRKAMDIFFDYGARLTFSAPVWKLWKTRDWKIFCQSQKDEFEAAGHYVDKKLKEIESAKNCQSTSTTSSNPSKALSFLEHLLEKSDLKRDESLTLCLELLAGGIDTSSNAVTFTLYELSRNKNCQEKLRQLIFEDEKNGLSGTNTKSARYLRACVVEALRLHPLTYVNMRKTNRDIVLSGYQIPSGTTVRYTPHLMHLKTEDYFPKAEEYIPDRWADRASSERCKKQFVFTPFGHGARQCPGRRIAEQEFDLLIRGILQNFRVEYHHEDMGVQVRLFNCADKPAKFSFISLNEN
ncbi:cytochrome P450 CYP12A2-like [Styela clava]